LDLEYLQIHEDVCVLVCVRVYTHTHTHTHTYTQSSKQLSLREKHLCQQ